MGLEQNLDVLTDQQIDEELKSMQGWGRDGLAIAKEYHLNSFIEAIAFVNRVAAAAADLNHHPDMIISFDEVRMRIWTHKKNAVTRADFILAKKIDELAVH